MTLLGHNVSFDLDDVATNTRFLAAVRKLNNPDDVTLPAMKTFLKTCLPQDDLEKVLPDGKVSTLITVFTAFIQGACVQARGIYEAKTAAESALNAAVAELSQ